MNDSQATPSGWASATVADLSDLVQYGSSAKTSGASAGVPVLRMGNIVGGRLDLSDLKYLPRNHHEFPDLLLAPGDMLFNRTNSPELVGKTAVYDGSPSECSFASYLLRVRLTNYEPVLLSAYINSPAGREWVASVVNQQVGQANVNGSKLRELEVPVPPLPEQRRIVAKLEALTEKSRRAKEALDAIPPLLERFRQSVLAAAFRGDLTAEWRAKNPDVEPADKLLQRIRTERRRRWEETELAKMQAKGKTLGTDRKYEEPETAHTADLPELPNGWTWASFDELSEFVTSGSRGWGEYYSSSGPLFIRSQDINTDRLLIGEVAHVDLPVGSDGMRTHVSYGDVLVTITGANVTRAAWVDVELPEAYVSQHVALIRLVMVELSAFVHKYLESEAHGRGLLKKAAYGGGKPGLNLKQIRSLPIPLVPAAEQQQISRQVQSRYMTLGKMVSSLDEVSSMFGALNRSILAKAFRGDLVPQDPSDEPASVLLDRIRRERAAAASAKEKKPAKRK